jgi:hypothetical protein
LRANLAGSASLGFDHDWLFDQRLECRGERPTDDVDSATWWKWIDERYGARRIGLLGETGLNGEGCCGSGAAGDKTTSVHVKSSLEIGFLPVTAGLVFVGGMLSPGTVGNQASLQFF